MTHPRCLKCGSRTVIGKAKKPKGETTKPQNHRYCTVCDWTDKPKEVSNAD